MGTMESSKRLGKKARQVGRQSVIRWESTLSVHNQNTFRPPHRIRIMCLSALPFALISSGLSLQSDRKSLATFLSRQHKRFQNKSFHTGWKLFVSLNIPTPDTDSCFTIKFTAIISGCVSFIFISVLHNLRQHQRIRR